MPHMARGVYVYGYEAEPADERPTDYGSTNFGRSAMGSLSTAPVPWATTEHSTFEEPSHAFERVQARRQDRRLKARIAAFTFILAVIAAGSAVLLLADKFTR